MTDAGKIERQSSSYKQGLVLGLTMAEIMLLLVFCLLIAAGAVLRRERTERENEHNRRAVAEAKLAALTLTNASPANKALANLAEKVPEIAEALTEGGAEAESKISEFWTTLVESREFVQSLETQGLSKSELQENASFVSEVMELKRKGLDLVAMKRNAEIVDALKQVQNANRLPEDPKLSLATIDRIIKDAAANAAHGDDPNGHKWPPMISLSEAEGYYFEKGSAQLDQKFRDRLEETIVPRLLEIAKLYDVDVIEVVGHTDEQPIGARSSNLDRDLAGVLHGDLEVVALRPGDNAGLGIARSVAVVRQLLKDERLKGMRILPMSGAQLIRTDQSLTNGIDDLGDVRERRRIEIRMRKTN